MSRPAMPVSSFIKAIAAIAHFTAPPDHDVRVRASVSHLGGYASGSVSIGTTHGDILVEAKDLPRNGLPGPNATHPKAARLSFQDLRPNAAPPAVIEAATLDPEITLPAFKGALVAAILSSSESPAAAERLVAETVRRMHLAAVAEEQRDARDICVVQLGPDRFDRPQQDPATGVWEQTVDVISGAKHVQVKLAAVERDENGAPALLSRGRLSVTDAGDTSDKAPWRHLLQLNNLALPAQVACLQGAFTHAIYEAQQEERTKPSGNGIRAIMVRPSPALIS